MTRSGARLVLMGLLALAPPGAPAFAQASSPREFTCGAERVAVVIDGPTLRLTAAGATYVLQLVPVGSGARYEAEADPSTAFWNQGQVASLRIRGRGYPECIATTVDPAEEAGVFRALGHEPGWRLDIAAGQLTLVTDYGQTKVSVPTPFAEAFAGGRRYIASSAGRPITATILDQPCGDSATGMPRPFTVRVEFAGQLLRGCGGDTQALLRGAPWIVETIVGAAPARGTLVTLLFDDDGRLSGSASCNSYSAAYTLTAEGLTIGPVAATRKACAPAVMKQEAAFLAALGGVQRVEVTAAGALVLHTANGQRITSNRE
jgi:heat shock protein HslJ/membrane-bound inhibitor of C-type lysozyme